MLPEVAEQGGNCRVRLAGIGGRRDLWGVNLNISAFTQPVSLVQSASLSLSSVHPFDISLFHVLF